MKATFRVAYRTVLGESLSLHILATSYEGTQCEHLLPMVWHDETHWEIEWSYPSTGIQSFSYRYLLHRTSNEVTFSEAGESRVWENPDCENKTLYFLDDWRSASTDDRVYTKKLFQHDIHSYGKMREQDPTHSSHEFRLFLSLAPKGMEPCLLGNTEELGAWAYDRAVSMKEISQHLWSASLSLPKDQSIEYKYGFARIGENRATELEQGCNRILNATLEAGHVRISDENFRRAPEQQFRAAGVAIPVFSLRSEESGGVGEFADLKAMGKWSASIGLRLIQILPINDTTSSRTKEDSYPYSGISVFALHPLYLRLDAMSYPLRDIAFFHQERARLNALKDIDYEQVMKLKWKLTEEVFATHFDSIMKDSAFLRFWNENKEWVNDYAVFSIKRDEFRSADFSQWGEWAHYDAKKVEALSQKKAALYFIWLQYELDKQLTAAVNELHELGISLKGDLPIGVDRDSVENWVAPHLFLSDAQAGAPPDAFATKGQNWGFPIYHWEEMKKDDYAWWRSRFARLSRYFDAYRIDHILGFFRIWQIPADHIDGIMGYFEPAMPISLNELEKIGIPFDRTRFCEPYLTKESVTSHLETDSEECMEMFFEQANSGKLQFKKEFSSQRKISDYFEAHYPHPSPSQQNTRQALLDLLTEILFHEVFVDGKPMYHPRISMESTDSFKALDDVSQTNLRVIYEDYFFQRQNDFWEAKALEKLPSLCNSSEMLLCGEDLGMVPACVGGVMNSLGILSLEIQRWPKLPGNEFGNPSLCPYLSVVSTSTHDMSTLRGWWQEDATASARFAQQMLGETMVPDDLDTSLAEKILKQHLQSPPMWAIFPLQDLLAIDEDLRSQDIEGERINIPSIVPFYWKWRMELPLEKLCEAKEFNKKLHHLISESGR